MVHDKAVFTVAGQHTSCCQPATFSVTSNDR